MAQEQLDDRGDEMLTEQERKLIEDRVHAIADSDAAASTLRHRLARGSRSARIPRGN